MGLVSCWPPGPQELAVQVQVIRDTDGGGTGFGVHGGGASEGLPRTACTRRAIRPMPRYEVIRDPVVQAELTAKTGENCKIRRGTRFELGEGLEKKNEDFAAEVAKAAGLS